MPVVHNFSTSWTGKADNFNFRRFENNGYKMPSALLILAEGAEEMETVITADVLRRGEVSAYEFKILGGGGGGLSPTVGGGSEPTNTCGSLRVKASPWTIIAQS